MKRVGKRSRLVGAGVAGMTFRCRFFGRIGLSSRWRSISKYIASYSFPSGFIGHHSKKPTPKRAGMMGGDACVALVLVLGTHSPSCRGDAQHKASPPRTTLPPPLRVRRGFRGDITRNLPVRAGVVRRRVGIVVVARVPFDHICMLHTKQVKQMKQTSLEMH